MKQKRFVISNHFAESDKSPLDDEEGRNSNAQSKAVDESEDKQDEVTDIRRCKHLAWIIWSLFSCFFVASLRLSLMTSRQFS